MSDEDMRPLRWIASARRDCLEFPTKLRRAFGYDLYLVQAGAEIDFVRRRLAEAEADYVAEDRGQ